LDASVYKGERFKKAAVLDVRTHFKRGFIKEEALRPLRTNASKTLFKELIKNFKKHLQKRSYLKSFIQNSLSEVNFEGTKLALQNCRGNKRILPFVTQYQPVSAQFETDYHEQMAFD